MMDHAKEGDVLKVDDLPVKKTKILEVEVNSLQFVSPAGIHQCELQVKHLYNIYIADYEIQLWPEGSSRPWMLL